MTVADEQVQCDCKVESSATKHGLEGVDQELVRRWTARDDDRASVRELTRQFNRRILAAAMAAAGMTTLDAEVETAFRLLDGDDVSSGMRTETRRRLERGGVDIESVEADFVSHQTLYTHLTECLGATRAEEDTDRLERERTRLRALRNRTAAVAEDAVARLRDGDLALDGFDLFVEVSVVCDDCGTLYDLETLLDRGGCDCQDR